MALPASCVISCTSQYHYFLTCHRRKKGQVINHMFWSAVWSIMQNIPAHLRHTLPSAKEDVQLYSVTSWSTDRAQEPSLYMTHKRYIGSSCFRANDKSHHIYGVCQGQMGKNGWCNVARLRHRLIQTFPPASRARPRIWIMHYERGPKQYTDQGSPRCSRSPHTQDRTGVVARDKKERKSHHLEPLSRGIP